MPWEELGRAAVNISARKAAVPAVSDVNQVLNVAAGTSTTIIITPPVGELWRPKYLYVYIPAPTGATTGSNRLDIGIGSASNAILVDIAAHNVALTLVRNVIGNTATTKNPTNEGEQQRAILSLAASNACPLAIYYQNSTDVVQNGTLNYKLIKEVEYIY